MLEPSVHPFEQGKRTVPLTTVDGAVSFVRTMCAPADLEAGDQRNPPSIDMAFDLRVRSFGGPDTGS
ncbi:hypothetical protein Vau01_124700 [Virgisporangium aurantiacum]|uniref:Uncharacterized protein n=1 Tax=Virgisporangium aurantiacum TaxID=175570 RepID=A0A8J3ZIN4_9ACTN|nr:hypothetical protein Vau01_124700 [Virgisporangium aurantiacum]